MTGTAREICRRGVGRTFQIAATFGSIESVRQAETDLEVSRQRPEQHAAHVHSSPVDLAPSRRADEPHVLRKA